MSLFLLASKAVLFPTNFKRAKLIPIHKKDSLYDRNTYRPSSILPIVSKLLERHVSQSYLAYLTLNNLVYSKQSAYGIVHTILVKPRS